MRQRSARACTPMNLQCPECAMEDAGRDAQAARCSHSQGHSQGHSQAQASDGVRLARVLTRSKKSCRCIGQSSGISLAVSIVRRISKRSGSDIGGETSSDMIPAGRRGRVEV